MTTGRMRFTLAALTVALLPAMAAAQPRKVVPADQVKAGKSVPTERGQTPASMGIHGFSVVLVVGGTQGATAGATDTVPEAARKALADMKDFLPYKRYQLLDAAWILCCGPENPIGKSQVSGRVRGPDGRDYVYAIDPGEVVGSKLNLRFTMREVQEMPFTPVNMEKMSDMARLELAKQQAEAARELDDLEIHLRAVQQGLQVGAATTGDLEAATARVRRAQQRAQDLQRMSGGVTVTAAQGGGRGGGGTRAAVAGRGTGTALGREMMDSSFSITPGETVVIGTSRISGDQALIAILTAATKPGGAR